MSRSNDRQVATWILPRITMRLAGTCRHRRHKLLPLFCILMAACSKVPAAPPPTREIDVGVVTLSEGPVTTTEELTGRTSATAASDVRPQVDGIILARLFREGAYVRAGQQLYQIDPRQYHATQNQASAALESAQATYVAARAQANRYASLSETDAISGQQRDDIVASARAARAAIHQNAALLQSARINVGYTLVRAPIAGRIGRSYVTPGALVTAGQTSALASIQQLDPIYVDIVQSSDALLALRRALARGSVLPSTAAVTLKLSDGSSYPHSGRIEFSEVTVDETGGTVTLRARFPNPQGLLLPGMFVRVIASQGIVPNGILAPQQGIARDAKGNATALVVGPANKVVQVGVVAAQAIGNRWLITQGLKRGDRLIVDGTEKVVPGAIVRTIAVASPDAGSGS